MSNAFSRTQMLYGQENMQKLYHAHIAVFGLGGVGGYVVEALTRSGIGALDIIDHDRVCESNLNRQILATRQTIGMCKTDAAAQRIAAINPECTVRTYPIFYTPDTAAQFDFTRYDYIVDAIDTVTGKLELITQAFRAGIPVISSMGMGNKCNASALEVADISQTSVCPLARIMRKELKKRGIFHLKVVYSREKPVTPQFSPEHENLQEAARNFPECSPEQENSPEQEQTSARRQIPASNAFVPATAGLIIAGEVVNDLVSR